MDAPFPPNSFDVITAFDVLEHVYDPREFLEQVQMWLRPGGIFFAKLPNIDSWEAKIFGTYWYGLELPRHLSHFSVESLRNLVCDLGFRETRIKANDQGSHMGHSMRYVCGDWFRKLGYSPVPMAKAQKPNLAWRIARKALWLSLAVPLSRLASAANAGVVLDVVLKKEAVGNSAARNPGRSTELPVATHRPNDSFDPTQ
jgi:SAM-dependent methyltransferase